MLTHVPSPTLKQWLKVFSFTQVDHQNLLARWKVGNSISGILSKSTWSLGLIAEWRKKTRETEFVTVFVPSFFCNSALAVLRASGHQINFYPVDCNGSFDLGRLRQMCKTNKPDLLVFPHYFAMINGQAAELADIAKSCSAWLVEDCAHSSVPVGLIGSFGDFVFYSPHKSVPVPYGSVLTVRTDGPSKLGTVEIEKFGLPDTWAIQALSLSASLDLNFVSSGVGEFVWLVKRLVQRAGLARKSRSGIESVDNDGVNARISMPQMPRLSARLLDALVSQSGISLYSKLLRAGVPPNDDIDRMNMIRQCNSTIWDEFVSLLSDNQLVPVRGGSTDFCPYLAVYEGEPDQVMVAEKYLKSIGIPVSVWPDLPPEVASNSLDYADAVQLRANRLYLPVHASILPRDLSKLMRKFKSGRSSQVGDVLDVDIDSNELWTTYLEQVEFSNVLNAWEYGEAKSNSEGWVVKHKVHMVDGKPIAISQILEKRVCKLLTVARLSRGPLLLKGATRSDISIVLSSIASSYSIFKAQLLSISPEFYVNSEPLPVRGLSKFHRLSPFGTQSSVIDLEMDVDLLRKNLESKWRNQLKANEKSNITIRQSSYFVDFCWFEDVYEKLKQEKNFPGIQTELFHAIWTMFLGSGRGRLFVGELDGCRIGAVLIVMHGTTATYLAGWNGEEGRTVYLNNRLLWEACCQLKAEGFTKFDLGGIDEVNNSGVARFKNGMRGESYKTIGEFLKI
jgi:hypothetical protein